MTLITNTTLFKVLNDPRIKKIQNHFSIQLKILTLSLRMFSFIYLKKTLKFKWGLSDSRSQLFRNLSPDIWHLGILLKIKNNSFLLMTIQSKP